MRATNGRFSGLKTKNKFRDFNLILLIIKMSTNEDLYSFLNEASPRKFPSGRIRS